MKSGRWYSKTLIADEKLIGSNPLGLATVILVSGEFLDGRQFLSLLYSTALDLRQACIYKTYYLTRIAPKQVRFAEYTFHSQHQVGTMQARVDLRAAHEELDSIPNALLMHGFWNGTQRGRPKMKP